MREKYKDKLIKGGVILGLALILGLVFYQLQDKDIFFARRAFYGLVRGQPYVSRLIDWEHFKGLGADVGQQYSSFISSAKRKKYEELFIKSFSAGFKQAKGKANDFIRWRLRAKDVQQAVVAADYLGHSKTILLTLTTDKGGRKLKEIQWQE